MCMQSVSKYINKAFSPSPTTPMPVYIINSAHLFASFDFLNIHAVQSI